MSVDPGHRARFEALFQGQPLTLIGAVRADQALKINRRGRSLLEIPLEQLLGAEQLNRERAAGRVFQVGSC